MRRRALFGCLLALACLAAPANAFARPVPSYVLSLATLTNESWQHATYFATGDERHWYGGAATFNTSGLWLDGFDDQHEVSLTVYADERHGERAGGYDVFPTFAIALVRSERERLSVNLHSDPGHVAAYTLSTSARADDQDGRYVYPRRDGETITVAPGEDHDVMLKWSGEYTYVYNRDGARPLYADGAPLYCDWADLTDAAGLRGHVAYRWDAYLDGKVVDSAWLPSPTGRIKIESNKRHFAYPARSSRTDTKDARLLADPLSQTWRRWDRTVPTGIQVITGDYATRSVEPYTWMYLYLPSEAERPKAAFVKYTNPVAYDLKSLRTTRFYTRVDRDGVRAELTVRCPSGVKKIYSGSVGPKGQTFYFPAWDGTGPRGEKLPSAVYDWQLKLTKDGATRTYSGKISVSRVYFSLSGVAKGGSPVKRAAYMVAGNANCYVTAKTSSRWDMLTVGLSSPAQSWPSRYWYLGATSPLSTTTYFRGTAAVRAAGLKTWTVTGRSNVAYTLTVIQ
jgi:hypothetical protein